MDREKELRQTVKAMSLDELKQAQMLISQELDKRQKYHPPRSFVAPLVTR